MPTFVKKLASVLDPGERRRAFMVWIMMVIAALLEVAGVASILPFIGVLSNPAIIEQNALMAYVYRWIGFSDQRSFLVFLGVVLLVTFLVSLAFRALTIYAIQRFSIMRIHTIALRLLSIYMGQTYEFFLHHNSASLGKSLLSEVATVASSVLLPAMRALSGAIVCVSIIGVLIIVEPLTSLILSCVFVGSYLAVDRLTKTHVRDAGQLRLEANDDQYRIVGEAIQGLKELRVLGREADYISRFKVPSRAYAQYQSAVLSAREMPFYIIQAVAFGGMLTILLFWIIRGDEVHQILPLISFFAFAGYRLLPAFQDVFRSVGQIRFALPALDQLVADMKLSTESVQPAKSGRSPLRFEEELRFANVSFRYRGAEFDTLSDFSLTIPTRSRVAMVGHTGAGKSTVADLVLGLLTPTAGEIQVDGVALDAGNMRAWQANLGYVPQHIFLTDDTIAANVAFGVPYADIDQRRLEKAARQAQIYDFIMTDLPKRFDTMIGEKGERLSGGQRQRLGIARALYHDPKVIVFDEATSALDNLTEAAVMDSIENLGRDKTVILVAHRFSTIKTCDFVCFLEKGQVVAFGRYEELMRTIPSFRDLANGVSQ